MSVIMLVWLYGLRSAKLCKVHNAQSGPPSGTKIFAPLWVYWHRSLSYFTISYVSKTLLLAVSAVVIFLTIIPHPPPHPPLLPRNVVITSSTPTLSPSSSSCPVASIGDGTVSARWFPIIVVVLLSS